MANKDSTDNGRTMKVKGTGCEKDGQGLGGVKGMEADDVFCIRARRRRKT